MFVDRIAEINFLNTLLNKTRPTTGQLLLLYGRRRVGKTALLRHWVETGQHGYTYWMASKESPDLQRRSLAAAILNVSEDEAPRFDSWTRLWEWVGRQYAGLDERHILIIDELPYASEADAGMLAAMQQAWDQQLRDSQLIMALCGSQVNIMEAIMQHQSPLFGRLTAQWLLQPLPFYALAEFFPTWSTAERVALYAVLGSVPAYLEWLDPDLSFIENLRQVVLAPGSLFSAEPTLLLYEELTDLHTYQSILRAISQNKHTVKEISTACLLTSAQCGFYLSRLQELHFVERRLPVTLTPSEKRRSRRGRYHLSDPYFRFYYRFVLPHMQTIRPLAAAIEQIRRELRPFVAIAFERLCQQWIEAQALREQLPFAPEQIGSHWSKRVQIDVVAINFTTRHLLLAECKWQGDPVRRSVVRELFEEKRPKLFADLGWHEGEWQVHYAFFSREGFTVASAEYAAQHQIDLIDLPRLDAGLEVG